MVVGIDDACAVAGLISLSIEAFSVCVKGFTLLCSARSSGQDVSVVRCMIETEQHKLNSWADTAGLLADPPVVRIDVNDIVVAQNILHEVGGLLTDVKKLKSTYHLDLEITDDEVKELHRPDSPFGRLGLRQRPKFYSDAANVFRKRNSVWKKLRWVAIDVDGVRSLVKDIRYFNDQLGDFLQKAQQERMTSSLGMLLRTVVVGTEDRRDLSAIEHGISGSIVEGAVAATAHLKQKGLLLGVLDVPAVKNSESVQLQHLGGSKKSGPVQVPDLSMAEHAHVRLHIGLLARIGSDRSNEMRQVAEYDDNRVVVEWKASEAEQTTRFKSRVKAVAALLRELVDPSFHSLPFRGFLKDPSSGRYGYVFDVPHSLAPVNMNGVEASGGWPAPLVTTLRYILGSEQQIPSLNQRIVLAIELAESVLQLHTFGWIHKGICSDNMLLFNAGTERSSLHGESDIRLYLCGYTYARPDSPSEMTEATTAQYEATLYRHPQSLGVERELYRKTFDLYSLGCVLIELGIWSPLQNILFESAERTKHNFDKARSSLAASKLVSADTYTAPDYVRLLSERQTLLASTGLGSIHALLEARAGKSFAQVVRACLNADQNQKPGDEHFFLHFEESCLSQLRAIEI